MKHSIMFLQETDVMALADIGDAINVLDECFSAVGQHAAVLPRQRATLSTGTFHLMAATYEARGVFGLKAYFAGGGQAEYHIMLYSAETGRLVALIEADHLSQLRTGAASGLASRLLARPDASVLGVIGTGKQAFWQVAAICAVRPIRAMRAFSRNAGNREAFAALVQERLGIAAQASATAEACVRGADVVVTITKSSVPVCLSEWVVDGAHINAAGANAATRRELDEALVLRAAIRATDDVPQARLEAAEFRDLAGQGLLAWDDVRSISDLLAAPVQRAASDVTIFKSLGVALEDVAFARLVYERAVTQQRGQVIGSPP